MPAMDEKADKFLRRPMGYPASKSAGAKKPLMSWGLKKLEQKAGAKVLLPGVPAIDVA